MSSMIVSLHVKPGESDAVRAFTQECVGERYADFDASERRIGLRRESWHLLSTPGGDQFVFYIEGADLASSVSAFVASQDPFDMWFKERVLALTGVDFTAIPATAVAETLAEYSNK
jgi:hypothetical protein